MCSFQITDQVYYPEEIMNGSEAQCPGRQHVDHEIRLTDNFSRKKCLQFEISLTDKDLNKASLILLAN